MIPLKHIERKQTGPVLAQTSSVFAQTTVQKTINQDSWISTHQRDRVSTRLKDEVVSNFNNPISSQMRLASLEST